jgi:hypothetical protein
MIGTGENTCTIAAIPVALTGIVDQPSSFITVAGTFLVTLTCSKLTGYVALRPGTPVPDGLAVYETLSLTVLNPFSV